MTVYRCLPEKLVDEGLFRVVMLEAEYDGGPWSVFNILTSDSTSELDYDIKLWSSEKLNWEDAPHAFDIEGCEIPEYENGDK